MKNHGLPNEPQFYALVAQAPDRGGCRIIIEENRDLLMTRQQIVLGESAHIMAQRIMQAMTSEHNPKSWKLGGQMSAIRELTKMSRDPTFSQEFFIQRGLTKLMRIIHEDRNVPDRWRLVNAASNIMRLLGGQQFRRREILLMNEVEFHAVAALPALVAMMGGKARGAQMTSICLVNVLLEKPQGKTRADMIKVLLDKPAEEAINSLEGLVWDDNSTELKEEMNIELEKLKKTIKTGLEINLTRGLVKESIHQQILRAVGRKGEQLNFLSLLEELDLKIAQESCVHVQDTYNFIKEQFQCDTLHDAFANLSELVQDISMIVLQQMFPELSETFQSISSIPLDRFTGMDDALKFVDATIRSGVASQVEKAVLFTMGNSGVGKTSLVNTLMSYVENPSNTPQAFLTEDNEALLETRVMEMYDDVSLGQTSQTSIKLKDIYAQPALIEFQETPESAIEDGLQRKQCTKICDMGGHQEYYCCSSLFAASSGTFLVCTDSRSLVEEQKIEEDYYSCVGTYLELITQATATSGIQPKIVLVATKCDEVELNEKHCKKLLDFAKSHLGSVEADCFLVDQVLMFSSKEVTQESLCRLYGQVSALCNLSKHRLAPLSWFQLLDEMKSHEKPSVSLKDVQIMLKGIKEEHVDACNISEEETICVDKLKNVMHFLFEKEPQRNTKNPVGKTTVESNKSGIDSMMEAKNQENQQEKQHDRPSYVIGESSIKTTRTKLLQESFRMDSFQQDEEEELMEEVKPILDFWVGRGEILWFKEKSFLCGSVLTKPMDVVKSMRTIISHTVIDSIKNVEFHKTDLLEKGLLSYKAFEFLYNNASEQTFDKEKTWHFLIALGLACPLIKSGEKCALVPCLVTNRMEDKIARAESSMEKDLEAVCFQYMFNPNSSSIGMYYKFITAFTETFLWGEKGGEIWFASSQKVENRKLGRVGGLRGVLKWHVEGVQEPQVFEFLILEYETTDATIAGVSNYAVYRGVRIYLRSQKGPLTKAVFLIMQKMNLLFSVGLGPVQRTLQCKECQIGEVEGHFDIGENLELQSDVDICSQREHMQDAHIVNMIKESLRRKSFKLQLLMEKPKRSLGLEIFEQSQIKAKILSNKLEAGEQIWIYRDRETDPINPIALVNPYAHVMIYVGQNKDNVHEVVHVVIKKGLSRATIARQPVMEAIKPTDHIFLGHKIDSVQFAANIREKIAERAIVCARQPRIVFDYDHR